MSASDFTPLTPHQLRQLERQLLDSDVLDDIAAAEAAEQARFDQQPEPAQASKSAQPCDCVECQQTDQVAAVYWLMGHDNQVAYVGVGRNLPKRLREARQRADMRDHIAWDNTQQWWHGDMESARAQQLDDIKRYAPRFNGAAVVTQPATASKPEGQAGGKTYRKHYSENGTHRHVTMYAPSFSLLTSLMSRAAALGVVLVAMVLIGGTDFVAGVFHAVFEGFGMSLGVAGDMVEAMRQAR